MTLRLVAGAAVALALVLVLVVLAGPSKNRPAAPRAAAPAPTAVPASGAGETAERVLALQAAVRRAPRDTDALAQLGLAYYQRVRETGDLGFYVRAEGVLRRALTLDPRSADAAVGLATVALARHDFRGGLRYARMAQRLQPQSVKFYPGLVDALVELGRYREAGRVVQRFVDLRPALPSYARVSYFRELHGDLGGALAAMRYAVSAGAATPENTAYVQSLVGDLEVQRGRPAAARRAYEQSLASVPGSIPAEAGLAQVEAAAGRFDPAVARLRSVVERLPLPQYVTALGEIELAAGRPAAARADFAVIGAEEKLLSASGVNADAELAIFHATHGNRQRAVALGRRAWRAAPSVRSADALGWSLTQAGRPAAGWRWARRSLKLGTRDPLLLYHAGVAARDAGRRATARRLLSRALAANPRFSAYYAPRARRALEDLR